MINILNDKVTNITYPNKKVPENVTIRELFSFISDIHYLEILSSILKKSKST